MASSSSKPPPKPKPPVVVPGSGNNILINSNQRLNPLLECIRNVGKEFGDIVPDFQVGRTTCVLYLSLKYHRLHPEYIHQRIERLGHAYGLRILLMLCDVSEHQDPIRELTKTCLINNITIVVAWTVDEAGLYLSTFKAYEHRPPDMIKERVDNTYDALLRASLTSIPRVNKTDVETLKTSLGSFANIGKAPADQLRTLPGFGQIKVKKLKDAFERPFRNQATSTLPSSFMAASQQRATYDAGKNIESIRVEDNEMGPPPVQARRPRSPSPEWDIELDL
ncbi:DNA repair protein rad10 [Athelia psychrophila]|uniref:DNA repair protein rad10 n=1 Tax=Athelia psychrophila TaxID=1759441 RepID=A0A166XAU4_9AGAM|nr:DNA repair protein rad10 [Fibularhizoctonia sp. CBS 109695]